MRAARKNSSATIDRLASVVEELWVAVAGADVDEIARREDEYHRVLNLAAGDTKLALILRAAGRYTPYPVYAADLDWREKVIVLHEHTISALRAAMWTRWPSRRGSNSSMLPAGG